MEPNMLIAYATKTGATAEVAEFIGEVLREKGVAADVRPAKEVNDLSPYRAVIIGSGVRIGKVFGDAVKFAQKHRDALKRVPVAYFVVCMTMKDDTPENRETVTGYLAPLCEIKEPESMGLFAGVVDYSKLGFLMRMMFKQAAEELPEGDYRDWDAIRAWAETLVPALARA